MHTSVRTLRLKGHVTLMGLIFFLGCARQGMVIDHRSNESSTNAQAITTDPMIKSKEIALTGFPDWCSAKPQADNTTCIVCERTTENNEKASLTNLCFQPRSDFDPKIQCGLSKTDVGIKLLQCHALDKDVSADASLPVDKSVSVLTTVLFSVKNALTETYKDDATSLAVATEVAQFASDHVLDVMVHSNIDQTASDLLLLANKYLVTPYPDGAGKDAIKAQLVTKLTALHDSFAGASTFSATKLFAALLDVAHVYPDERLGKAATVLTGAGIAKLVDTRRAELDPAVAGWTANNLGFTTTDELISQIKGN